MANSKKSEILEKLRSELEKVLKMKLLPRNKFTISI